MADGIVIPAGGPRLLGEVKKSIRALRDAGCHLPIEIWHLGFHEMPVQEEDLFNHMPRVGVRHIDAPGGWELKAIALQASKLDRVLLLDADTICAQDPTPLFDMLDNAGGTIFWPGGAAIPAFSPAWAMLGLEPRRALALDSAQVLVDKHQCADAIAKCAEMNRDSAKWYKVLYGDKDTFLMAWLATSTPYYLVPSWPKAATPGYWQHDLRGDPLFRHADGILRDSGATGTYEGIAQDELPGALALTRHQIAGGRK